MVDERVARVDEHDRASILPAQGCFHRPWQRDPSRFAAERERGERLVGVGERVDVVGTERTERVTRLLPLRGVGLGAPGEVDEFRRAIEKKAAA